jgi:hypothetical protein
VESTARKLRLQKLMTRVGKNPKLNFAGAATLFAAAFSSDTKTP